MIFHNCDQRTDEWLKIRLGKLTGSSADAIASNGKGLETLVFDKVAEIITGKLPPVYKNSDMERGNELEEGARIAYEFESGNVVEQVGFVELDEYTGCSPDGMIDKDGLVEIKCPKDSVFVRCLYDGKIDSGYMWQMQFQMYVTDRKWCDYVVYNPNFPNPIIIKRVERNETQIAKIKAGLVTGTAMIKKILEEIKNK